MERNKEKEMRAGLGNVDVIRRDMGRLLPVYLQPLLSTQGREKEDKVMKKGNVISRNTGKGRALGIKTEV